MGDLTASHGECSSNDESCYNSFYIFTAVVIILAFTKFSGQLGGLLVLLRAIEVEDKVSKLASELPELQLAAIAVVYANTISSTTQIFNAL